MPDSGNDVSTAAMPASESTSAELAREIERLQSLGRREGDAAVEDRIDAICAELLERASGSADARREVFDDIVSTRPTSFPWNRVRPQERGLAFLYQFAPWVDTGAVVASKRLREEAAIVDVISVNGAQRRHVDPTTSLIGAPYVDNLVHVDIPQTWAHWGGVRAYVGRALKAAERLGGPRSHVYSRAMWVPSHYAGAMYKLRHPDVPWVAEFSDPLSLDVEGKPRPGQQVSRDPWYEPVFSEVERRWGPIPEARMGIFGMAEWLVYALADTVLFTNDLQRQTMLETIEHPQLRESVAARSVVRNHPSLPARFYDLAPAEYAIDPSKVNLAYFGEFYATRGIGDLTTAMRMLPSDLRPHVHLHVFTNYVPAGKGRARPVSMSNDAFQALVVRAQQGIGADGIEDQVHLNASLPYLQFLNVTRHFDYLVVCDARSGAGHHVNPFLPSKWSDYANSSAGAWAFVEEGSSLSGKPAEIKTPLGDPDAARRVLMSLIEAKRGAVS